MTGSNQVIHSFVWKAGERVLVLGIGILVQIILARLLLPEDFACLAIINAILNYLGLFVQCGLSIAVVQKKDLTKTDLSTLSGISLAVALVLFVALYFLAPAVSRFYDVGDLVWPIRVMGLSLFLYSFNAIQTGMQTRQMRFRTLFFRGLVATTLSGILGIALAYAGFGIWALVAYNVTNILLVVVFMNLIPDLRIRPGYSRESAKALYPFSLKILGTNLISAGGDTVRTLTIGKVYSPSQLAYFDRGLSYSSLVTQVVNASISSVLLPTFSRAQEDRERLTGMVRRSVRMSAFVMVPVLAFVAVAAKPLVGVLLTEKWVPCAVFLSVFCLLRIPGVITSIDKQVFYALGNSQIALYYEAGLLAANLVSLFVLIPHGVLAVAIGFTAVEYLGNLALCLVAARFYGYTLRERWADLRKPVLSTAVVAALCWAVFRLGLGYLPTLLIQAAVAAAAYFALAKLSRDENLGELKNMIISTFKEKSQ